MSVQWEVAQMGLFIDWKDKCVSTVGFSLYHSNKQASHS
ncbi:MAG: hypothetical protein ACI8P3_001608 [Saprospiraceae bacterium]|jgi:hypothetical protein